MLKEKLLTNKPTDPFKISLTQQIELRSKEPNYQIPARLELRLNPRDKKISPFALTPKMAQQLIIDLDRAQSKYPLIGSRLEKYWRALDVLHGADAIKTINTESFVFAKTGIYEVIQDLIQVYNRY